MSPPMFKGAFFISFKDLPQTTSSPCCFSSCCVRESPSVIPFATKHPRKLVPGGKVEFCSIRDHHCHDFAKQQIIDFFKRVVPYSVIYIEAHGGKNENCLFQKIHNQPTSVDDIASLLNCGIPLESQIGLKIHLLACESTFQAKLIMEELHKSGFKKTSVVGYSAVISVHEHCHGWGVSDFGNWSDAQKKYLHHGQGIHKIAYHNYLGRVIEEDYHSFKKDRLEPELMMASSEPLSASEQILTQEYALRQSICHTEQLDLQTQLADYRYQQIQVCEANSRQSFCETEQTERKMLSDNYMRAQFDSYIMKLLLQILWQHTKLYISENRQHAEIAYDFSEGLKKIDNSWSLIELLKTYVLSPYLLSLPIIRALSDCYQEYHDMPAVLQDCRIIKFLRYVNEVEPHHPEPTITDTDIDKMVIRIQTFAI